MTFALALGGWAVAVAAIATALALRGRLELVARAEHELRGPATVLGLAWERLRRDPATRRQAKGLETELVRLRAGLADLAAARQGRRAAVVPAPVELDRVARSAVAGWAPALRGAGREARIDWRAGRTKIVADRGRLAQALGNLLANATEHGSGPLELRGRRLPGAVRVEVRNAMPAASARRPRSADRGRGLAIAARAAESAGGRLELGTDAGEVVASLELPVADGGPAVGAERRRPVEDAPTGGTPDRPFADGGPADAA